MKKTYWILSLLLLVGIASANSFSLKDIDESNFDVDEEELVLKDLESIEAREDAFGLNAPRPRANVPAPMPMPMPGPNPAPAPAPMPGPMPMPGPNPEPIPAPVPIPVPVPQGRWFNAANQNCLTYCPAIGRRVGNSPEGTQCASGEVLPLSAKQSGVAQVYGCYGTGCVGLTDYVRGAYSVGNFCYMPRQKQDRDRTDITIACFCE